MAPRALHLSPQNHLTVAVPPRSCPTSTRNLTALRFSSLPPKIISPPPYYGVPAHQELSDLNSQLDQLASVSGVKKSGASSDAGADAGASGGAGSADDPSSRGTLTDVAISVGGPSAGSAEPAAAAREQLCRVQRLLFTSLPVSSSLLPQALGSRSRARSFSTVLFPLRAPGACSSPRSR